MPSQDHQQNTAKSSESHRRDNQSPETPSIKFQGQRGTKQWIAQTTSLEINTWAPSKRKRHRKCDSGATDMVLIWMTRWVLIWMQQMSTYMRVLPQDLHDVGTKLYVRDGVSICVFAFCAFANSIIMPRLTMKPPLPMNCRPTSCKSVGKTCI